MTDADKNLPAKMPRDTFFKSDPTGEKIKLWQGAYMDSLKRQGYPAEKMPAGGVFDITPGKPGSLFGIGSVPLQYKYMDQSLQDLANDTKPGAGIPLSASVPGGLDQEKIARAKAVLSNPASSPKAKAGAQVYLESVKK
jgi:hypothetical protein